jgi:hypothetical protein
MGPKFYPETSGTGHPVTKRNVWKNGDPRNAVPIMGIHPVRGDAFYTFFLVWKRLTKRKRRHASPLI